MNIFKKTYCRVFQSAFKLALPFLPYREPEILKSCSELPSLLISHEISHVLIVTDNSIVRYGLLDRITSALNKSVIDYFIYDGTSPNPTNKNVNSAADLYTQNKCQAIIAVGGGSSIDCAKAVGALIARPGKQLNDLKGLLRIHKKTPPLIAIPTTAGTGSENTLAAVITDSVLKHKYVLNDFVLIPDYAVLDASLTLTLPPSLTATTGMDALTHAVEAYIGRSTTAETRAMALSASKLIFENIKTAYSDGSNLTARQNMLLASYQAGFAFSRSYVGYVHAIAHSLGGQYNTPHGLANAIILPTMLECYGESVYEKLYEIARYTGVCGEKDSYKTGAEKFISAIRRMNAEMSIPSLISYINTDDIETMAKHADKEANPLYPVPRLFSKKELENIYLRISGISCASINSSSKKNIRISEYLWKKNKLVKF